MAGMAGALREQGQLRPILTPHPGPQFWSGFGMGQLRQHRQRHGLKVAKRPEAQAVEAILQARGQIRQAAQGLGREKGCL